MKKYRVFIAAFAFIMAISGALVTKADASSKNVKSFTTLFRPSDCVSFSCITTGTVSCNNYDQTASGGTCSDPLVNALFHS